MKNPSIRARIIPGTGARIWRPGVQADALQGAGQLDHEWLEAIDAAAAMRPSIFAISTWSLLPIREFGAKLLPRSGSNKPGGIRFSQPLPP